MLSVGKMAAFGNNTVYLAGSVRGEAAIGSHYVYSLNEEIFLFKMSTIGTDSIQFQLMI